MRVLRLKDTRADDIFGGLEAKGKGAVGRELGLGYEETIERLLNCRETVTRNA